MAAGCLFKFLNAFLLELAFATISAFSELSTLVTASTLLVPIALLVATVVVILALLAVAAMSLLRLVLGLLSALMATISPAGWLKVFSQTKVKLFSFVSKKHFVKVWRFVYSAIHFYSPKTRTLL